MGLTKFVSSKTVRDIDKFLFICIINFVVREERTYVFNKTQQRSAMAKKPNALHFVCSKMF